MSRNVCFLSGLVIPSNRVSEEHYFPKMDLPYYIANNSANLFIAHSVLNSVKANWKPCEWEAKKIGLTQHAISSYHIKNVDRKFLIQTLENWNHYKINPCDYCLARYYKQYCINSR